MKLLLLLPLAMGSITAARVMAGVPAQAPATPANMMDPTDDINFDHMSAKDRANLIKELQASGEMQRPERRDDAAVMSPEGDFDFSSMSAKERADLIKQLTAAGISRRDVEDGEDGENGEDGEDGEDLTEAEAFSMDGQWDAEESEKGNDEVADDEGSSEELAARSVDDSYDDSDAHNDPELKAYIANGNWDDDEDMDAQLNADYHDPNALSRRDKSPTNVKDLVVLPVVPECYKHHNPRLLCRIIHARRQWCQANKDDCKKQHPWLYDALYVNKAKKEHGGVAGSMLSSMLNPSATGQPWSAVYASNSALAHGSVTKPANSAHPSAASATGTRRTAANPVFASAGATYNLPSSVPVFASAGAPISGTPHKRRDVPAEPTGQPEPEPEPEIFDFDEVVQEMDQYAEVLDRRDGLPVDKVPVRPKCMGEYTLFTASYPYNDKRCD